MAPDRADLNEADRRRQAADIFADALETPPDARSEFLRQACGEDGELRHEVETLLRALPEAGDWFDRAYEGVVEAAATQVLPSAADPTGRIVSHYRLEEFLGAGGMGEVYRARDVALGREAAVKLLRPGVGQEVRSRLVQEARAAAQLTHPAIAQFYDAGVSEGVDFLAMEFVDGTSLRKRLRQGPLPSAEALSVASALLEAMVHAHAAGFLHRDIKPENIMLTEQGATKLLDFGLAKDISEHELQETQGVTMVTELALTSHGAILGTPGYMSPEQLQGQPVDERTDVFALGAVLFEMLTGKQAFGGSSLSEINLAVMSKELPSVRTGDRGKDLPPDMDLILRRAVASDLADRYPSASAFLSDLRHVVTGEAIAVLPNTLAIANLQNLRADPEDDWIGSGVAESLAVDLRRAQGLKLVPRGKVMKAWATLAEKGHSFDAVALGLAVGCRWVLTGSFQRAGAALRLTMQLVEVATGSDLWMEKLDGTVDDVFGMQDRLAALTAESLDAVIPQSSRSVPGLDVFECFTRAKTLLHRRERGLAEQGRELLERALELDPDYAPALATMAHYHAPVRWWTTGDSRDLATALEYANRAIEADPELAEGYLWRGYAQWRQGAIDEAIESLRRVEALDPSEFQAPYFIGCAQTELGRWEEALESQRQAMSLEPEISYIPVQIAMLLIELGDLDAALWTIEKVCELERAAGVALFGRILLATALRHAGQLEEARRQCLEELRVLEQSDSMTRASVRPHCLMLLGSIALDQGDLEAATVAFEQAVSILKTQRSGVGSGYTLVRALVGLTRAGRGPEPYEEARRLIDTRAGFNFSMSFDWECQSLLDLARAARTLGREDEAQQLIRRAREAGTRQPLE